MKKLSVFVVGLLSLSLVFVLAGDAIVKKGHGFQYPQAFMENSPGTFDVAGYSRAMDETFNWLKSEASLAEGSSILVKVTDTELAAIDDYQCETCLQQRRKLRTGLVKTVGASFSFYSLDGVKRTADGGFVWTGVVESPGAAALRLHFSNFNLPDNSALYVYGLNGEAFGPYTNLGPGNTCDFWSHTVTGPVVYVQLRHFGEISETVLKSITFSIEGMGYLNEKFLLPFMQQKESAINGTDNANVHCSYNEPCVEDASCYSGTAVDGAKKAVALMQWISGAWIYMCTGGLIADIDSSSQIPYFLTANHCISKSKDARSLECYFQYQTSSCHGACYDPVGVCPRTLGASVMATGTEGDHTLLQLDQNPPAGSVFMGWTTAPVTEGTHLFRISHPSGGPQAYSEHIVDSSYVECSGLPVGEFIYSKDIIGAVEGGSDGAPVYTMSGQIVGQLFGSCGYTMEVCDAVQNRTVDGAFAFYYSSVAEFLDNPVCGGCPPVMYVDSIVLSTKKRGPQTDAVAKVTILDLAGSPVEGATVTGTFSGDVNGTQSAATAANGEATLKITVTGTVNSFVFCVDNVTHASLTYDPVSNVETCDSI